MDADFGLFFIKVCTYFPFDVKVCFNGHEWAKQQLRKEEIGFEALNNGFLSCENLERLQVICHQLDVEKIQALAQARADFLKALDIIAADGKYGNAGFLRRVKGLRCRILARLNCGRVLYSSPPPATGKKGHPHVHGARFAFKEPQTWGTPDEVMELEDSYWGRVRLQRWRGLHEKKGADVPYDVIQACVHLERETPPPALWLAWLAPE